MDNEAQNLVKAYMLVQVMVVAQGALSVSSQDVHRRQTQISCHGTSSSQLSDSEREKESRSLLQENGVSTRVMCAVHHGVWLCGALLRMVQAC